MAIRYLLLAALVGSAFSAHASPEPGIYASTGNGTVLLATTATGQVQTYMPRAVEGFFMYTAPTAPVTAPVLLAGSGQSTVPTASFEAIRPTPDFAQAPAGTPAEAAGLQASELTLADIVIGTPSADVVAELNAGLTAEAGIGAIVDAAAPTVLLPQALEANAVPEPGSGGLMLAGLAGVGLMARRRRSR